MIASARDLPGCPKLGRRWVERVGDTEGPGTLFLVCELHKKLIHVEIIYDTEAYRTGG